ncbi:MAG: hypothetical protein IJ881_06375, partial [Neisseriaceae bacterium]|nr:hypothetical protein [Neisseriaceae bacterium]
GAKSKDDKTRTPMNKLVAAGKVGGFTEYNFYLPNAVQANDIALKAGSAELGKAAVNAYITGDANLKQNDIVHLISTQDGVTWNGKGTVYQGITAKSDLGSIKVQGNNLDLTMLLNNNGSGNVVVPDPKVWNILSNTTYTTDAQANPAQTFSGQFNAAKNTENAMVNVKANKDYQALSVYGSDKNGLTMSVDNAKNLGNIDTGKGNLKKLTVKQSTAKAVNMNSANGAVQVEDSTIDSLTAKNGNGTAEITLAKATVNGAVNASQIKALNISNTSHVGDVSVTQGTLNIKDNSTAKAVKLNNADASLNKSTADSVTVNLNSQAGKIQLVDSTINGAVNANNHSLNISSTSVGGTIIGKGAITIDKKSNITGDIGSTKINEHSANISVSDSMIKGAYGNQMRVKNSNATGTVYGYQLDMALNNNTIGEVWVDSYNKQKSNVDSSISGTGTIGRVRFNPTDAHSANAVGTLNVNGNITVSGSLNANENSTLNINADKGTLKASEVTGWQAINFANLSDKHAALQLTGNNAADFGNKIKLSGSLNDYDDGKKYVLINSANGVNVNQQLFAENKRTGNEFDILSDAQYQVEEFGFHQDDAKKSLYINTEKTKFGIANKQFNAAEQVENATININQAVDYQGLNVQGGGNGSVINWTWGRHLGEINGNGGVLNIGSANKATQMNQRTAGNISNVSAVNFYLPANIKNNDWAVQLLSDKPTDLSKAAITAFVSGADNINDKDTVHLIQKTNGGEISVGEAKANVQQGITGITEANVKLSDDKLNLNLVFAKETQGS